MNPNLEMLVNSIYNQYNTYKKSEKTNAIQRLYDIKEDCKYGRNNLEGKKTTSFDIEHYIMWLRWERIIYIPPSI